MARPSSRSISANAAAVAAVEVLEVERLAAVVEVRDHELGADHVPGDADEHRAEHGHPTVAAVRRCASTATTSTTPSMNTASAASSRCRQREHQRDEDQPHDGGIANHHANSSGVTTSASGWKLAHVIHWIGAYIRYATANARPIHGRCEAVPGDQVHGQARRARARTPGRRTGTTARRRASRTARSSSATRLTWCPQKSRPRTVMNVCPPRETSQNAWS